MPTTSFLVTELSVMTVSFLPTLIEELLLAVIELSPATERLPPKLRVPLLVALTKALV